MKLLVVEDDPDLLQVLDVFFRSKSFEVELCADAMKAITVFRAFRPDVVLLDLSLRDSEGWQVLNFVRAEGATPVIMITGALSPEHATRALEDGADDYVRKPIDLKELDARIRSVLRRTQPAGVIHSGDVTIDDNEKHVQVGDRRVNLPPRIYNLLKLLMTRPGYVFSEKEILEQVWPDGGLSSPSQIKRYIYILRKKIEKTPTRPKYIQSVPGFGYRFTETVAEI